MKKYTKKQVMEIKKNPYTFKVTEQRIFFTIEFKKVFWIKYQAGMAPRKILEELGYNLECFKQKQIDSLVQRIKKQALNGEFTQGQSQKKRALLKKPEEELCPQTIKHMQSELLYLRQEVDFLKKILQQENPP